jgi:pantoate--beta-alanine ligase
MKIIRSRRELHDALGPVTGSAIGFVPTMGALHAGHISLVERARQDCDSVVVSVFVNPTQFNDPNDLKNYPRTPEADALLLESAGADVVFMPTVEEIYPEPDTRAFDFGGLDSTMEGATRPGHFNGVAQVVSRLFEMVRPAKAYFGRKDFQQVAIIKQMVYRLGMDVEIVECPIVREADGLALSSRNVLLDAAHRAAAPEIYAALQAGAAMTATGSVGDVEKFVTDKINSNPLLRVIYFNIVDNRTLQRAKTWQSEHGLTGCVAVQAGDVRLIDNISMA